MSETKHHDPYHDVDWDREENLPPSALLTMSMGLLIAVGAVAAAGIGAIISAANGNSAVTGGIIGAIVGIVLAILFVVIQTARLRGKGR